MVRCFGDNSWHKIASLPTSIVHDVWFSLPWKGVSIEFLFRGKGNIEKLVKSLMQRHGKKIKKIRPSIVQRTPAIKSFNFLAKRTVGGCHATITTHP